MKSSTFGGSLSSSPSGSGERPRRQPSHTPKSQVAATTARPPRISITSFQESTTPELERRYPASATTISPGIAVVTTSVPSTPCVCAAKGGKLRLMYEANPMSFIIEQAGGAATTGRERILDIQPSKLHQRVPVILGSKNEVERVTAYHKES